LGVWVFGFSYLKPNQNQIQGMKIKKKHQSASFLSLGRILPDIDWVQNKETFKIFY
jgi:hypothetical protein